MPVFTIEVPEGAHSDVKKKLLKSITEAIDETYHFPDLRDWLREYPAENVSHDGRVGAEPVRPVCMLEAPVLTSLDGKRKLILSLVCSFLVGTSKASTRDRTPI